MKKVINEQARTVTFAFDGWKDAAGAVVNEALAPIVFDPSAASAANRAYAELHGFAARIGDAAALTKSAENGFKITEAMRREAVGELATHYASGAADWNVKVTSAKKVVYNPHIQAIAEKRQCTYEAAMAWFNAKLMAELAAGE